MSEVTRILSQIEQGDPQAAEQLLPLVYDELRKLAAARLAQEKPGQTLQATALVHEAYLRLVGGLGARSREPGAGEATSSENDLAPGPGPLAPVAWDNRRHFFSAAAEAMRRILVESARRKQSLKHGGQRVRIDLDEALIVSEEPRKDLLVLDELVAQLAGVDAQAAELIKLRFFAGLTGDQAAEVLGISSRSADMLWAYARAWLFERFKRQND
jgi:DNA-directed RNA polymerase specialized sigma24 family protein